jgi:hypothetical protein
MNIQPNTFRRSLSGAPFVGRHVQPRRPSKSGNERMAATQQHSEGLEMRPPVEAQFETLGSAHDFVALLAETVAEAK